MPGHPQAEFRRHHTLLGEFAPGAAVSLGGFARALIPIWSSNKIRIRFEVNRAGTLRVFLPLPGLIPGDYVSFGDDLSTILVADDGPADTPVVVDTQVIVELGTESDFELAGEAFILLEYEEDAIGDAIIAHCTVSQS